MEALARVGLKAGSITDPASCPVASSSVWPWPAPWSPSPT